MATDGKKKLGRPPADEPRSEMEPARCGCVGNETWCSHIGRCKEFTDRGISKHYCSDCLANALAEER